MMNKIAFIACVAVGVHGSTGNCPLKSKGGLSCSYTLPAAIAEGCCTMTNLIQAAVEKCDYEMFTNVVDEGKLHGCFGSDSFSDNNCGEFAHGLGQEAEACGWTGAVHDGTFRSGNCLTQSKSGLSCSFNFPAASAKDCCTSRNSMQAAVESCDLQKFQIAVGEAHSYDGCFDPGTTGDCREVGQELQHEAVACGWGGGHDGEFIAEPEHRPSFEWFLPMVSGVAVGGAVVFGIFKLFKAPFSQPTRGPLISDDC